MLQARPAAMGEEGVAAIADAEHLLQVLQHLLDGIGTRKWSELTACRLRSPTIEHQSRILVFERTENVGIGFIVAQGDVVARPLRLDQIALEQQRLGLVRRDRHLDARDPLHQRGELGRILAAAEVAADAIAQTRGLADVQQLAVGIVHAIDAGTLRQRRHIALRIEVSRSLRLSAAYACRLLRSAISIASSSACS